MIKVFTRWSRPIEFHAIVVLLALAPVACTMPHSSADANQNGTYTEAFKLPEHAQHVSGQLLIKFKHGVDREQAASILALNGTTVISRYSGQSLYLVALPDSVNVEQGVRIFSQMSEIEFAEPNHIYKSED